MISNEKNMARNITVVKKLKYLYMESHILNTASKSRGDMRTPFQGRRIPWKYSGMRWGSTTASSISPWSYISWLLFLNYPSRRKINNVFPLSSLFLHRFFLQYSFFLHSFFIVSSSLFCHCGNPWQSIISSLCTLLFFFAGPIGYYFFLSRASDERSYQKTRKSRAVWVRRTRKAMLRKRELLTN